MKKILLLLTLAAGLNVAVNAQDKPVSFGVKAGLALPSQTASAMGISISTSSKTSFYVGAVADINISPIFSFQPGLTYIGKGGKFNVDEMIEQMGADPSEFEGVDKVTFNYSYLELPLNLLANFNAGTGKFFIGAGPYAAYALSANMKAGDLKVDADFGSDEGQDKRMEFGVNFLGGYKLNNGLNLHAGYGLGLTGVQNSSSEKTKNRVFSVGLGFMF
ncbi:porin family protein [Pedobacter chitinilyticus]|uniref:PorT family protein n=1 Tax=Pedobacter chitinilyticus TaxID=2233776 RepID=A0A3S3SV95_9SPHI|nr:porin family protein [Pedobacter chitinilyticus]RWU08361.1 PorT family protein [Pedobacter chitinilyticus]